jgi:hypothetical protein
VERNGRSEARRAWARDAAYIATVRSVRMTGGGRSETRVVRPRQATDSVKPSTYNPGRRESVLMRSPWGSVGASPVSRGAWDSLGLSSTRDNPGGRQRGEYNRGYQARSTLRAPRAGHRLSRGLPCCDSNTCTGGRVARRCLFGPPAPPTAQGCIAAHFSTTYQEWPPPSSRTMSPTNARASPKSISVLGR